MKDRSRSGGAEGTANRLHWRKVSSQRQGNDGQVSHDHSASSLDDLTGYNERVPRMRRMLRRALTNVQ